MQVLPESQLELAVYLINMDGAEDRLRLMTQKLQDVNISAERATGIDGRKLDYPVPEFSEISYKLMHGRRRTPAEVGCYLSHVACARKFLESNADLALILEDDVEFEADFTETLDAAARHTSDWDILRLTTVNRGRKFPFRSLGNHRSLAIALTREKGAGAYVINRRAAKWITTKLIPMRLAYDIAFDLEYLSGLKAAFVHPLPADQNTGYDSQIQNDVRAYRLPRWRYITVMPHRAYLEVTRFVARSTRLMFKRLYQPSRPQRQMISGNIEPQSPSAAE